MLEIMKSWCHTHYVEHVTCILEPVLAKLKTVLSTFSSNLDKAHLRILDGEVEIHLLLEKTVTF